MQLTVDGCQNLSQLAVSKTNCVGYPILAGANIMEKRSKLWLRTIVSMHNRMMNFEYQIISTLYFLLLIENVHK